MISIFLQDKPDQINNSQKTDKNYFRYYEIKFFKEVIVNLIVLKNLHLKLF
ncbi:hypothetical protein SXCC_02211 [Gluconacetobacter sp. SXCC-1]|nr:hypothetical protein SXCC_02211 [Gluconacetobacter sp. SXCC-1]